MAIKLALWVLNGIQVCHNLNTGVYLWVFSRFLSKDAFGSMYTDSEDSGKNVRMCRPTCFDFTQMHSDPKSPDATHT